MDAPALTPAQNPALAPPRAAPAPIGAAERAAAGLVSLGCLSLLLVALWIKPSADGHGSHTQLGLPPCGWAIVLQAPCPTCGMTTSFAHAVRGQFAQAFTAQPFALLAALGTAAAFWAGLHISLTGSQLGRTLGRMVTARTFATLAALAAASWAYKWITW